MGFLAAIILKMLILVNLFYSSTPQNSLSVNLISNKNRGKIAQICHLFFYTYTNCTKLAFSARLYPYYPI